MMRNIYACTLLFTAFLISPGAHSADVTKVKGSGALIDLKGEGAAPGDTYFTIGSDGKRKGILQINKVKGDKAIGKILKGKVDVGQTLEKRASGGGAVAGGSKSHSGGSSASTSNAFWGGMAGISMDKMSVGVNSATVSGAKAGTAAMSGIGYSAMGFYDYQAWNLIWFRGLGGLEGFNAAGGNICGTSNTSACNASIYYISLDFVGRFVFSQGNLRPWIGAGVALMFPASKSSTALDSGSISNTSVIQGMGGVDWFISKDMFIPVSVEYGMLPKSSEVEASWMAVRFGLGVPF